MIIKTIDINALEWFDKINGNSYFSAEVIINFGLEDQKYIKLPFQYGYGDHYREMAFKALKDSLSIVTQEGLYAYCRTNNIILRCSKRENCLKRDLK